jgi:hypothetical protein
VLIGAAAQAVPHRRHHKNGDELGCLFGKLEGMERIRAKGQMQAVFLHGAKGYDHRPGCFKTMLELLHGEISNKHAGSLISALLYVK